MDTVYYIVTNICNADTVHKLITIYPLPDSGIISVATYVCVGASTSLSESVTGGTWHLSNNLVSITTGSITGIGAGLDTIYYFVTNACGTSHAQVPITINPLPVAGTIMGRDSLCVGATDTLTSTVTGGAWGSINGSASISGGVVTGITVGTDTINYIVSNICGLDTSIYDIRINTKPTKPNVTGGEIACINRKVDSLSADISGGNWNATNGNATVFGGIITPVNPGTDTIIYSISNFCGRVADSAVIIIPTKGWCDTANGVPQVSSENEIQIYPNPTNGVFTVELPFISTATSIVVFDMYGKVVKEIDNEKGLKPEIDLSQVAKGTYMVKVNFAGKIYRTKIVVL